MIKTDLIERPLAVTAAPAKPSDKRPAIAVGRSIRSDGVVCLFDGVKRSDLTPHLRARYGMSPAEYRSVWGLPDDYPMTAEAPRQARAPRWNRRAAGF